MARQYGALVVFGSGPGVGRSVATLFAERGYAKVIIMSRNAERLKQDGEAVRAANVETSVEEITVDMGNANQVQASLKKVDATLEESGTPLEAVLFNAARTASSNFFEFPVEELENDLRVCSLFFKKTSGRAELFVILDRHHRPLRRGAMGHTKIAKSHHLQLKDARAHSHKRHAGQRSLSGDVLPSSVQSWSIQLTTFVAQGIRAKGSSCWDCDYWRDCER